MILVWEGLFLKPYMDMTSSLAKVSSIEEMMREREEMRSLWVDRLKEGQDRMKSYADRHGLERQTGEGDWGLRKNLIAKSESCG